MKLPIAALGTAVLGIAVGFIAGKGSSSSPAAAEPQAARESGTTSRTSSSRRASGPQDTRRPAAGPGKELLGGRDPASLTAAEAFKIVQAGADTNYYGDPLEYSRRNYEFQLMLSKLPLPVLEELIKLSQASGGPAYRTRQMFTSYASRDLHKALAWAATQPDAESLKNAAISATARNDPAHAMEMFQQGIMEGRFNRFGGTSYEVSYAMGATFAKQGKEQLLQFLDSVPSGLVTTVMSNAVGSLPKEDIPGFMDEISQRVKDGKVDSSTLKNILSNLVATQPELAMKWIAEKTEAGPERTQMELGLVRTLFQQGKSEEAEELVKNALLQTPGKEKETLNEQIISLLYSNPDFAVKMVSLLPPGQEMTKEDVTKLSERGGAGDPFTLSKMLKSPEDQASYLEDSIARFANSNRPNEVDFRVMERRLEALGLSEDGTTRVRQAIAAAREKAAERANTRSGG